MKFNKTKPVQQNNTPAEQKLVDILTRREDIFVEGFREWFKTSYREVYGNDKEDTLEKLLKRISDDDIKQLYRDSYGKMIGQ